MSRRCYLRAAQGVNVMAMPTRDSDPAPIPNQPLPLRVDWHDMRGWGATSGVHMRKSILASVMGLALVGVAACAGGPTGPVDVRGVVTEVQVSEDGQRVTSIVLRTESGDVLALALGDRIDPTIWDAKHLEGHLRLGETLGFTIGVTYTGEEGERVAIQLIE